MLKRVEIAAIRERATEGFGFGETAIAAATGPDDDPWVELSNAAERFIWHAAEDICDLALSHDEAMELIAEQTVSLRKERSKRIKYGYKDSKASKKMERYHNALQAIAYEGADPEETAQAALRGDAVPGTRGALKIKLADQLVMIERLLADLRWSMSRDKVDSHRVFREILRDDAFRMLENEAKMRSTSK